MATHAQAMESIGKTMRNDKVNYPCSTAEVSISGLPEGEVGESIMSNIREKLRHEGLLFGDINISPSKVLTPTMFEGDADDKYVPYTTATFHIRAGKNEGREELRTTMEEDKKSAMHIILDCIDNNNSTEIHKDRIYVSTKVSEVIRVGN